VLRRATVASLTVARSFS